MFQIMRIHCANINHVTKKTDKELLVAFAHLFSTIVVSFLRTWQCFAPIWIAHFGHLSLATTENNHYLNQLSCFSVGLGFG